MSGRSAGRVCRGLLAALVLATPLASSGQEAPRWPDTYVSRLEALALLQTLNAEILGSASATATLETWCRDHRLAPEPRIVAHVVAASGKPATDEQRARLEVKSEDEVQYRKVDLRCGSRVLSQAENWYVPARLTAEMNRLLQTTDTPFGKIVAPLGPFRRTHAVSLLWRPLPAGWERGTREPAPAPAAALEMPEALFEHRAVLYTRENRPFAEVHEVYQRQVLAFSPRAPD